MLLLLLLFCSTSTLCLAQALLKCSIPNSIHSSDFTSGLHMETGGEMPTLRDSIINWLLMNEQSEETEDNCKPHLIITRSDISISHVNHTFCGQPLV